MSNEYSENSEKELVESVKEFLSHVKGVDDVFILTEEDKVAVAALEKEAEGNVLMGMGEGDNQGIKEVFKREHILCITTNKEYVWPEPPNVIMMQGEEIIGFDCSEKDIEKYENQPDYFVMGTFVMSKTKAPKSAGKPIVVLPPKPCDLGGIEQACDAILGSPSTPSDEYIRKVHDFSASAEKGTFFVGFNKKK
ncbi:MAG: hypothetical protein FWH46_06245 [Methanimicrococcus sp.]|nr:hypothetical protein [Methanimicrococcus sp.]